MLDFIVWSCLTFGCFVDMGQTNSEQIVMKFPLETEAPALIVPGRKGVLIIEFVEVKPQTEV